MFTYLSRIGVLGLAASVLLGSGVAAQAGLLSANSGGAIPGFTGSQLFDDTMVVVPPNVLVFTMSANVDYAVFAPGTFDTAFPGQDPSGGTDYVYAYQIENLDTTVISLTVGLDGDEPLGTIGFISDLGLVDPSGSLFVAGGTSAAWDFNTSTPFLDNGLSSAVLFFTSSAAPQLDTATVSAQIANTHLLPSPLPEPATLGLFVLGASLIALKRDVHCRDSLP